MPAPDTAPSPFSLRHYLPDRSWLRPAIALLERLSGLRTLRHRYEALAPSHEPRLFLQQALAALHIDIRVTGEELGNIPREGGLIIVANHPFGALDGLVLARVLLKIRPDIRLLANFMLQSIPGIRDLLIGCDPFISRGSRPMNRQSLNRSIKWLNNGGALVIFPAGEVSHYQLRHGCVTDPEWLDTAGRLAVRTRATVVPVFIHGRNSVFFHLAGLVHPVLRTILLPRQVLKQANSTIRLQIGKSIIANKLEKLGHRREITNYLRLSTYMLADIADTEPVTGRLTGHEQQNETEVVRRTPEDLQKSEIRYLPEDQLLLAAGQMEVYYARARQIPWVMQEIGRLREITFRDVGEGTGRAVDLDLFDEYYLHLFVWNAGREEIVGAYRLGLTDEILDKYGKKGLYTHTLFKYKHNVLARLNPAIELGRSFVRPEYQCSYLALNILWKGIGVFVARQARYPVLFGPVSISNEYDYQSRKLMIDCLSTSRLEPELAAWIKPRRPFHHKGKNQWKLSKLSGEHDIDTVSWLVSQIEKDNKGIPILFKQYLKLGGKFLCFNVDDAFSDVVDGLIMVDLRKSKPTVLNKYMGRDNAAAFLAWHRATHTPGMPESAAMSG